MLFMAPFTVFKPLYRGYSTLPQALGPRHHTHPVPPVLRATRTPTPTPRPYLNSEPTFGDHTTSFRVPAR
jgi:hypothetical protein